MREKGGILHQKALDLPYGSKYMWEYIDYLDGRMFTPIEKFTIGELSEPFLTYEEFSEQKEQEKERQRKQEEQEKKQEHDQAYYDWSSRSHEKIMEALENHYTSGWFPEYSKYMDAEREKAKTEYSVEQLRKPVLSYEEFAAEREREAAEREDKVAELSLEIAEKENITDTSSVKAEQEGGTENREELPEASERQEKAAVKTEMESKPSVLSGQQDIQRRVERTVTKQIYEKMTDKEKEEWIGIDENDMNSSIKRYRIKMAEIGVKFADIPEMTEGFMKLWSAADKMKAKEHTKYELGKIR